MTEAASAIIAHSTKGVGGTSAVQVKNASGLETAVPPRGVDSVQFSTGSSSISHADMERYVGMLQNMQSAHRAEGSTPEDAIVNGLIRDLGQ